MIDRSREPAVPWAFPWTIAWTIAAGIAIAGVALSGSAWGQAYDGLPPLNVEIIGKSGEVKGMAKVYPNYVELVDALKKPRGSIGVMMVEGKLRLFLVKADNERSLIGWSERHRLYNAQNKLVGYYNWTPIWSYIYDTEMKKVGQAQCIAYQGVCAAGIAGFLLGLF